MKQRKGFTLIEILIVIGLIAVLAGVLVVALNPARQFAQARNAQRYNNIDTIMGAIINNQTDNKGIYTCSSGAIPATATAMASGAGNYDMAACLVPTYFSQLPYDPADTNGHWTSAADYNTGYTVMKETDGRVTIAAPSAELGIAISLTR